MQDTLKRKKNGGGADHLFHEDSRQFIQHLLAEIDEEKRIRYFEQAVDQLLQSCFSTLTKLQEIKIQLWKGNSYETFGAWDKASSAFQCVIDLCDSYEFSAQKAKAHRFIGHIQIRQNRFTEALASYEESLRLTKDCGDEKGEASSYNGLAFHYLEKGLLGKATSYWEKALKLAVKMNDTNLQANCYNNLGIVANVEGNWEKALAHYGESLPHYEKMGDSRGLAKTYYNLARTYADAERWSEAGAYYEKAYKLAKEVGDAHTQADIKLNRAELYITIGDFNLAEALCQQAVRMYSQLEDHLGEAEVFKFMGKIYTGKHDWQIAQSYFEESVRLTRNHKSPLCQAEAHLEYGRMWKQEGNNGSALKQYKLALNLFIKVRAQKQVEKVKQEIAEQSPMRMPTDTTTKTVE